MARTHVPEDRISVAIQFNDRINARDFDGLVKLMTDDHRFVDSAGNVIVGREEMRDGWKSFFEQWPDYKNVFGSVMVSDDTVIMLGRSYCSEDALNGPAIWTAKIRGRLVAEWRVSEDTPQTRRALGLAATQKGACW